MTHAAGELAYQAERASRVLEDLTPTPDYILERYRRARHWKLFPRECFFKLLQDFQGKQILDFGCGEGEISTQLALLGGHVTGIDISPELTTLAERRAELDGVAGRVRFLTGDVLKLALPQNSFDAVVCYAVLHHVNMRQVIPVLRAAMKPGGLIVMVEPIAFSPALQRLRDALPVTKDVSPEERQLDRQDMEYLLHSFAASRAIYFSIFGRLSRFFRNASKIDRGHPFTRAMLLALNGLDRLLLAAAPSLSKFSGIAVISGRKP